MVSVTGSVSCDTEFFIKYVKLRQRLKMLRTYHKIKVHFIWL